MLLGYTLLAAESLKLLMTRSMLLVQVHVTGRKSLQECLLTGSAILVSYTCTWLAFMHETHASCGVQSQDLDSEAKAGLECGCLRLT